jgi:hypothetical protein
MSSLLDLYCVNCDSLGFRNAAAVVFATEQSRAANVTQIILTLPADVMPLDVLDSGGVLHLGVRAVAEALSGAQSRSDVTWFTLQWPSLDALFASTGTVLSADNITTSG